MGVLPLRFPAAGEELIILALPSSILFLRELELPIVDRRRLREVVPLELTGETALESDELAFDAKADVLPRDDADPKLVGFY